MIQTEATVFDTYQQDGWVFVCIRFSDRVELEIPVRSNPGWEVGQTVLVSVEKKK